MNLINAEQILNMVATRLGSGMSLDDNNNNLLRLITEGMINAYLRHVKDGFYAIETVTMESSNRTLKLPCGLLRLLRIKDANGQNYTIHTNNGSIATINAHKGDKVTIEYMGLPFETDENGEQIIRVPYQWGDYIAWEVAIAWFMQPRGIEKKQADYQFLEYANQQKRTALNYMNTVISRTEIEQALNTLHSFKLLGTTRKS